MKNYFLQTVIILLSVVLLTGSTQRANAQISGFKLADYKNPVYLYQALDLGFNLNSSINNQNVPIQPEGPNLKTREFLFSSDLNATYTRYSNRLSYQGDQQFSIGLQDDFRGEKEDPQVVTKNSQNDGTFSLGLNSSNRFYFRSNYFLEASPYAGINYDSYSTRDREYDTLNVLLRDQKSGTQYIHTVIGSGLFFGKGRIEQVQDAQLAAYILNDLEKLNRVKQGLSNEDVMELAATITKLKMTRFFDDRIHLIREITAIDSLLEKRGIKTVGDAAYFTAIYDNWQYAHNPVRQSGYRLYGGLQPSFRYQGFGQTKDTLSPVNSKFKTRELIEEFHLPVLIGFIYEKPGSLEWQHSISASISWQHDYTDETQQQLLPDELGKVLIFRTTGSTVTSSLGYTAGYYPSTRTWLTAGISSSYNYAIYDNKSDISAMVKGKSRQDVYTRLSFNAYYYLSQRLRLSVQADVNNYWQANETGKTANAGSTNVKQTGKSWAGGVSGALTYSLF